MPKKKKNKPVFRSIPFSKKLRSHGFKSPGKGWQYQKAVGLEYYRIISKTTRKTLKNKAGKTRFFGVFGDKSTSAGQYEKKYPQFKTQLEGRKPLDFSRETLREEEKALAAGRIKKIGRDILPIIEGKDPFEVKQGPPQVVARSIQAKGGKEISPTSPEGKRLLKSTRVKFVYHFSDGSRHESKKFEKRFKGEIQHFLLASEKSPGSVYRFGSGQKERPIFSGKMRIGRRTGVTTTRSLVSRLLGNRVFKGRVKLGFDWRIFEGDGSQRELKGTSGGGFSFDVKKATKAFVGLQKKYIIDHLAYYLEQRRPSLKARARRKGWGEKEMVKAARLTKVQRDRIVKRLKRQGKVPRNAFALFVETKIRELAKQRGVIISSSKAIASKDFHGAKFKPEDKGQRSLMDEGWESTFQLNIFKGKK